MAPISVVIPTHDTRELTLRCLASLERGNARPESVIVIDDASADGSARAIAERHPEVRLLRNERALGFSAASNRGLAEARGPILLLLNSDTEVAPDCLEGYARAFHQHEELGVAGAALSDPDGTPQWSGGATPSALWLFAVSSGLGPWIGRLRRRGAAELGNPTSNRREPRGARTAREVDWVAGTALAMRREVWESCGPLDERFALYCQDLDLCLRVGEAGWRVRVLPECRVLHHHGATISRTSGERQDLERLWTDLVLWSAKWGGEAAARRTARTLRAGGLVRAAALATAGGLASGTRRTALRQRRAALRRAQQALKSPRSLGIGSSGHRDTAQQTAEERPEPRSWR